MKTFQSNPLFSTALLHGTWKTATLLFLICMSVLTASCSDDYKDDPMLIATISSYNEFGAAMLDVTKADMTRAGFTLGDIICITNFMAGEPNGVTLEQADVNLDGEVGIGDIITITNIMAGEE